MSNKEAYSRIQKKVKLKKGFYFHLGIYFVVIFFLFIINWLTNDRPHDDWWFLFPAASWGVAIGIHALSVFIFSDAGFFGEDWERKKIAEEMNKKGLPLDQKTLAQDGDLNMDQHLDLKEIEKRPNYDERDLV